MQRPYYLSFALALSLCSCVKDNPVADAVIAPDVCGADGARMQATIGGGDWCASGSVLAVGSGTSAIITGISLAGGTLVINVDSVAVGEQAVSEAFNSVLYSSLEGSYVVPEATMGNLHITAYDPTAGRIQGTATAELRLNGEGATKQISATFDATLSGE
jgi:hypothetical protein